jgi:hypothetical protein
MAARGFNRAGFPVHMNFESGLLTVMVICGFFLAKAGIVVGHTAWVPLPEIRYESFGLTKLMAVSWDNMIVLALAVLLGGTYVRDFGHQRQCLQEFIDVGVPYPNVTNRYLRALMAAGAILMLYALSIGCETLCPSPDKSSVISIALAGVLFRTSMLFLLYLFLKITPYVCAREYLIFRHKIPLTPSEDTTPRP